MTSIPTGSRHYKAFVGPSDLYDVVAAMQFNLLTQLGLREGHLLLDIGCGSLRAGRLFIPYLAKHCYYGIEVEKWLLREGIRRNVGASLVRLRKPRFSHDQNFNLSVFGKQFDYLLAQSIFSHASSKQISRCLTKAVEVMHENSIFLATFVRGDTNYSGEDWVYPACVEYNFDHIKELAQRAGLTTHLLTWFHPNGQTWVAFTKPDLSSATLDLLKAS